MDNRETALELAVRVFESQMIEPHKITEYAEKFVKFLDEPNQGKAVPEPDWDYFVDEPNQYSDTAYFRRIKGDDTSTSQFLGPEDTVWLNTDHNVDRDYMTEVGYRPISFEELPNWVKAIS